MNIIWSLGDDEESDAPDPQSWTTTLDLVPSATGEVLLLTVTRRVSEAGSPAVEYVWVIDYSAGAGLVEAVLAGSADNLEEAQAQAMGAALTHPDRRPVRYAWADTSAHLQVRVDLWTGVVDLIEVTIAMTDPTPLGIGEGGMTPAVTPHQQAALTRATEIVNSDPWPPLDSSPASITWAS